MSDRTRQTGQRVTIVAQRPGSREISWVRTLMGEWAGETVEDVDQQLVVPYSLVVTDRPDQLRSKYLAGVRRLGTVGLLHIADRRYRSRLDAYASFGWVWRTFHHTGLADLDVRQIPLGPGLVPVRVGGELSPMALRRPMERLYTWSVAGQVSEAKREMVDAMRPVEAGHEPPTLDAATDPVTVLEVLADSVFAPCPIDDGHLESTRIYDALETGAIPIVERRRWLDYFHQLFGDHPLPTVRTWDEAPDLVLDLLADQSRLAALHDQVVAWWAATKQALADSMQDDMAVCFARVLDGFERSGLPLDRAAPRWRGQVEMLRHRH